MNPCGDGDGDGDIGVTTVGLDSDPTWSDSFILSNAPSNNYNSPYNFGVLIIVGNYFRGWSE